MVDKRQDSAILTSGTNPTILLCLTRIAEDNDLITKRHDNVEVLRFRNNTFLLDKLSGFRIQNQKFELAYFYFLSTKPSKKEMNSFPLAGISPSDLIGTSGLNSFPKPEQLIKVYPFELPTPDFDCL